MRTFRTKGFTLLEIIIVVSIIGALAGVSAEVFRNMSDASALRAGGSEVYRALAGAQVRTLASENDTVYGVRIGQTDVTRFEGSSYVPGAAENTVYVFEGGVQATGTLVIAGTDIVFERLTGKPSATGTIYLYESDGSATTTILIHATGLIEYE